MKKLFLLTLVCVTFLGNILNAQFDDLYYDPETDDSEYYESYTESNYNDEYATDYYDDDEYDDFDYWNEYDEYYASRIRRFSRASIGFGFYSGYACNSIFYDPFDRFYIPYSPFGYRSPIYVSVGYPWGGWYNGFYGGYYGGFYSGYYGGYNGWYRPNRNRYNNCVVYNNNSGYYGNGYNNNVYPSGNNPKGTYYGSRRGGSTSSSIKGERRSPRIAEANQTKHELTGVSDNASIRTSATPNRISEVNSRNKGEFSQESTRNDGLAQVSSEKRDYARASSRNESQNITRERRTRPSRTALNNRYGESSSRAIQRSQSRTGDRTNRSKAESRSSRNSNSSYSPNSSTSSRSSGNSFNRSNRSSSRSSGSMSRSSSRSSGNMSRSASRSSSRSSGGSSGSRRKG